MRFKIVDQQFKETVFNEAKTQFDAGTNLDNIKVTLGAEQGQALAQSIDPLTLKRGGAAQLLVLGQRPSANQWVQPSRDTFAAQTTARLDPAISKNVQVKIDSSFAAAIEDVISAQLGAEALAQFKAEAGRAALVGSREFACPPSRERLESLWRKANGGNPIQSPPQNLEARWKRGQSFKD